MAKQLKTIQKELDTLQPIRIQGLLRNRKETLSQFLTKFFIKWNKEKDTL